MFKYKDKQKLLTLYIQRHYNPSRNGHHKLKRNGLVSRLALILCKFIDIFTRQWRKQAQTQYYACSLIWTTSKCSRNFPGPYALISTTFRYLKIQKKKFQDSGNTVATSSVPIIKSLLFVWSLALRGYMYLVAIYSEHTFDVYIHLCTV